MASVKYRLKTPSKKETTIIGRFYSKETGAMDFSTKEIIPSEYWQGQRVSAKFKKNHDRINKRLSQLECDLLDCWRNNVGADGAKIKALVDQIVKGATPIIEEKKTVISAVRLFIAQYSQEKQNSTVKMYRSILKKLEAFNPNLTFPELDFNFYDAFKRFLYSQPNPVYSGYNLDRCDDTGDYVLTASDKPVRPVGLFDDTVFKYIIHLHTICAWAAQRGYDVHPSHKEWYKQIVQRNYPVISLTLNELQRIEGLANLSNHLATARDSFSICCRTGQRISDVKRISALSISTGNWTIYQKKGSRQKQKVVVLPLVGFCEPVKDIITRYGGKLPEISEQKLNEHVKTLCKLAGVTHEIYIERWQGNKKIRIPGKKYEFIHLHTGKATFITILGNMGVPVKVISDFTGTSIKTIEKHYLGRTELYVAENYLKGIEEGQQLRKAN